MILEFDKYYRDDDYELLFNTISGLEILRGVDKKEQKRGT